MSSTVVLAATALGVRLEPVARALGATGVAVWACSHDRRFLNVLASHGYSESFLAAIGPIPVEAPVMTAMVFAQRRVTARRLAGRQPAAVAAPVISDGQTVGVLTAEFDPAWVTDVAPGVAAQAEMLAAQMALLVLTAAPEAGRRPRFDRPHRPTGAVVKRATRLAPVRPLPAAVASALELVASPVPRAGGGLMSSEAFVVAATETLRTGPAALGLVRIAPSAMPDFAALFSDDLRRKDLLGRYSEAQLVVLMPGRSAGAAAKRIGSTLDTARTAGLNRACAGVTASGHAAERSVEPLLAQAEAALSAAEVQGRPVVLYGAGTTVNQATVLVVDDDPDVVRMIDARLEAAGHKTVVAVDGQAALDAIDTCAPAVVVLELVLPKRSGFDVLARLAERPEPRPRVIVVCSRTCEEDVMRAFELGADDHLTKPFSPQELVARVGRLLG